MKLGNNAQNTTSYLLINVELFEANSAWDIEPSPYKVENSTKNPVFEAVQFLFHFWLEVSYRYILLIFDGNTSTSCKMPGAQSF